MPLNCRTARNSDVSALVGLMAQLRYDVRDKELLEVVSAIRQGHGEVFVAEMDGETVGCVNAIVDVRLAEGRVGEIASLVVRESHRGHGIGKALLAYAERWLSSRVDSVRIRANAKRSDAHGFYRAAGYTRVKEQSVFIKKM